MPRFEFEIDDAANCIFIRHFGVVDLPIILERGNAVLNHKKYRRGLNRITEFTNTKVDLSSGDIRSLTEMISSKIPESGNYREAVIVDNLLGYGLARIFHSFSAVNNNEYEIFSTENSDATVKIKTWLNLDADYIFPDFLSL